MRLAGPTPMTPASGRTAERGDAMMKAALLHRFWLPAVIVVVLAAFVPRALASVERYKNQGRAVGFSSWQTADAGPDTTGRFRWVDKHAAWREQVDGSVLIIPIFVDRPDVRFDVLINGVAIDHPISKGWSQVTCDVVKLLGAEKWKSKPMLTMEFRASRFGVGVGEIRWQGPRPD